MTDGRVRQRESFGSLLRRHRDGLGLTQEALAARSGLSVDAIGLIERGVRSRPRRSTVDLLSDALGLTPGDRDALVAAAQAAAAGELGGGGSELRPPHTSFVGREEQVDEVCALLLEADARLVTLIGPAGVGKTRLALAVGAALAPRFADGVAGVSLAPLSDPHQVGTSVQAALGIRDDRADPIEAIVAHCARRRLLLLLDNFERVLAASPLVVEIVATCPGVRLLVTSRVALGVRGERRHPVPPLDLPSALGLFAERARAVAPDFRLTAGGARTVEEICARLDGLPLALELAASWMRLLTPEALLERMGDRLALLVSGASDLPRRQRTMREALRWSYDLLTADQQALLRRLSMFAGSASVDSVEAVCQAAGPLPSGVLDGLAALVDHSLVQRQDHRHRPRVAMLQTVREFAAELLRASGEDEATADALLTRYASMAATAEDCLRRGKQVEWVQQVAVEHENALAMLVWAARHGRAEVGLRAAIAAWRAWEILGRRREGLAVLEQLLAAAGEVSPGLRAGALLAAGSLGVWLAEFDLGISRLEQALALCRRSGDRRGMADALVGLGVAAIDHADPTRARTLLTQALSLYRAAGDRWGEATALADLSIALQEAGDAAGALAHCERALAIRTRIGDTYGTAISLSNLAELLLRQRGDAGRAERALHEAARISRQLGALGPLAAVLHNLGDQLRSRGDPTGARELYEESIWLCERLGNRPGTAAGLEELARMVRDHGQSERAARLYGAAAAIREVTGAAPLEARYVEHRAVLMEIERELGPAAAELLAAGRGLSLDAAVSEAFEALGPLDTHG